jgi:hypothetical protein
MGAVKSKSVYAIKDFLALHKKPVVCFSVLFFIGIIVGIVSAVNSVGGQFEKIAQNEIVFGAVKVFFFSAIGLLAGYIIFAVSSCMHGMSFLSVVPFIILGYICGKYVTVLVGVYGGIGLMNLIFIYIPFFIGSFIFFLVGASIALRQCNICACNNSILRPSISTILKAFAINLLFNFVVFMLIGALTKVIIVVL